MTTQEAFDLFPDMLTMDGYDDCIIGIAERFGFPTPILAYDRIKILNKLVAGGMTMEDAEEWFEFNQIGAWVGDGTPLFVTVFDPPAPEPPKHPGPGCVICGKSDKRRFYRVDGVLGAVCGYCVNKRFGKRAT